MTVEENKQVVLDFYEAGNVGDVDKLLALLSDDIVWTNTGNTALSMTCNGKQNLIENLFGPLFGRLQGGIIAHVDNMFGEGDWIAVQVRGEATTVDGTPYNNTYCHIFRVKDGQIVETTEYFDTELVTAVFGG